MSYQISYNLFIYWAPAVFQISAIWNILCILILTPTLLGNPTIIPVLLMNILMLKRVKPFIQDLTVAKPKFGLGLFDSQIMLYYLSGRHAMELNACQIHFGGIEAGKISEMGH